MGELTKFNVAPSYLSFYFIKKMLDDFSSASIELVCAYLENCGRFLLLTESTRETMSNFVCLLI